MPANAVGADKPWASTCDHFRRTHVEASSTQFARAKERSSFPQPRAGAVRLVVVAAGIGSMFAVTLLTTSSANRPRRPAGRREPHAGHDPGVSRRSTMRLRWKRDPGESLIARRKRKGERRARGGATQVRERNLAQESAIPADVVALLLNQIVVGGGLWKVLRW